VNGKLKTVLGAILLAAVITGAVIAYNALSENYTPEMPSVPSPAPPSASAEPPEDGAQVNQPAAPDFTVLDIDGGEVKLSDFYGQPVVLNFWASWCPPCRAHKPDFDKIYDEMKTDVKFLMVNLTDGRRETVESASEYVAEHGYRFPVYYDTTQEAARIYSITSIPTTLFIGRDGHIIAEHKGRLSEDRIRTGIELISSS
jgi:thiol-disulfide isomerase/thioredoxin